MTEMDALCDRAYAITNQLTKSMYLKDARETTVIKTFAQIAYVSAMVCFIKSVRFLPIQTTQDTSAEQLKKNERLRKCLEENWGDNNTTRVAMLFGDGANYDCPANVLTRAYQNRNLKIVRLILQHTATKRIASITENIVYKIRKEQKTAEYIPTVMDACILSFHSKSKTYDATYNARTKPINKDPSGSFLNIVFEFFTLSEMPDLIQTCKQWKKVASDTKCLNFNYRSNINDVHTQSVLAKHISSIDYWLKMSNEVRNKLHGLKNLTSIQTCVVDDMEEDSLPFHLPSTVTTVYIKLTLTQHTIDEKIEFINSVVRDLCTSTPHLELLHLDILIRCRHSDTFDDDRTKVEQRIDFMPIVSLQHLQTLEITCKNNRFVENEQFFKIDSLSKMLKAHPSIHTLDILPSPFGGQSYHTSICSILEHLSRQRPPNLTDLCLDKITVTDDICAHLATFSSLTRITPWRINTQSLAWLKPFSNCTTLRVFTENIAIDDVCTGIKMLPQLTKLDILHEEMTSNHLRDVLQHLPKLKMLYLLGCMAIKSLDVFPDECPLHTLEIVGYTFKNDEFSHLSRLKHLTSKHFEESVYRTK